MLWSLSVPISAYIFKSLNIHHQAKFKKKRKKIWEYVRLLIIIIISQGLTWGLIYFHLNSKLNVCKRVIAHSHIWIYNNKFL